MCFCRGVFEDVSSQVLDDGEHVCVFVLALDGEEEAKCEFKYVVKCDLNCGCGGLGGGFGSCAGGSLGWVLLFGGVMWFLGYGQLGGLLNWGFVLVGRGRLWWRSGCFVWVRGWGLRGVLGGWEQGGGSWAGLRGRGGW